MRIVRPQKFVVLPLLFFAVFYTKIATSLEQRQGHEATELNMAGARRRRRTPSTVGGILKTATSSASHTESTLQKIFDGGIPPDGSLVESAATVAPTTGAPKVLQVLPTEVPQASPTVAPQASPRVIIENSMHPPFLPTVIFLGLCLAGWIQVWRKIKTPLKRFEVEYDKSGEEAEDSSSALALLKDETHQIVGRVNYELAVRIGLSCVFGCLPLIIPSLHGWFKHMKYSYALLGAGVIWTNQRNLGLTKATVKDSIVGILLAFFFCWVAGGIWPGGVTIDAKGLINERVWYCGLMYTFVTSASVLCLNWPMVTRLYCLPYHLCYMMHFLKPKPADAPVVFSRHFGLDLQGQAFGYVVVTILGGMMSVLASALPTPIMAHRTATAKLKSTSQALCIVLKSVMRGYMNSADQSSIARNSVFVQRLADKLCEMEEDIAASWWEHYDRGKYGNIRFFLDMHVKMSHELMDRVRAIQLRLSELVVTAPRSQLLAELKAPMEEMEKAVLTLFEMCTAATMDGVIDHDEKDNFASATQRAEAAMQAVHDKFSSACRRIAGDSFGACHETFARDYCIVYLICALVSMVIEFSRILSGSTEIVRTGRLEATKTWCRGIFKGLKDPDHVNFALRNSCSIFLSFIVGYFGFLDMVPKYTSDIATQTSMLISTYIGSGMQKNLRRFQGVTLGSFAGFALNRMYCYSEAPITLCLAQFIFTSTMFHIFLTNKDVGYSCYLAAVWASISMNTACPLNDGSPDEVPEGPVTQGGQMRVLGILLASFFIGMVDLCLANDAASSQAIETFSAFLGNSETVIRSWFLDNYARHKHGIRKTFNFLQQDARSKLKTVRDRSVEAALEPTYGHKRPWNTNQYLNFEKFGQGLRLNILTMQWAVLGISVTTGVALELERMKKDLKKHEEIKEEKHHMNEILGLLENNTQAYPSIKKRILETMLDLTHEIDITMHSNSEEKVESTCRKAYMKHKEAVAKRHEDFVALGAELNKKAPSIDFDKQLGANGEMRLHMAMFMLEATMNFLLKMQEETYVNC